MVRTTILRKSLMGATGCLVGLLILALAPTLLRQTAFNPDRFRMTPVRLIALQEEELIEAEEIEPEPEPPPEPEILPDPPEIEPPEIEMSEIKPPQTTYDTAATSYSTGIQLPNLTGLGLQGVKLSAQSLAKRTARTPLPGLPKHAPPRTRFNPDEVDQQPQGVATMQPMYPYRAKRLGIQGQVRIRFLVNRSGKTDLFKILESTPPGEFDKAVEKTVKRWKFKPAVKDRRPVETWVETTVQFKLQ